MPPHIYIFCRIHWPPRPVLLSMNLWKERPVCWPLTTEAASALLLGPAEFLADFKAKKQKASDPQSSRTWVADHGPGQK